MKDINRLEIFNYIRDSIDLDISEKGLLWLIFGFYKSEEGCNYLSIKSLKQLSKISDDRTLYSKINSLIAKGYLRKEVQKGIGCKYFISIPNVKITDTVEITEQKKKKKKIIDVKSKKVSKKVPLENDIEEVWKVYPNKKGKQAASKAIAKILKDISKDELLRTIERYKKDVDHQRKNGFGALQYKNGSTFFNGGYVDYLDSNYQELQDKPQNKKMSRADLEELLMGGS